MDFARQKLGRGQFSGLGQNAQGILMEVDGHSGDIFSHAIAHNSITTMLPTAVLQLTEINGEEIQEI